MVVRDFASADVAAYRDRVNPTSDVQELLSEMLFADLDQVTARIAKLEASIKKPTAQRDEYLRELELMKKLAAALEADQPIADVVKTDSETKVLRSFAFLSLKPALAVLNASEDTVSQPAPETVDRLGCLRLCAKIEEEIAQLPPEDRAAFLADLGVTSPARDRLIRACYKRLNLISFFTSGPDECRAWTIPAGTDAVTAAAEIHSDIARGFIRAETVGYDDLYAAGGDMKVAKANGKIRLEGKNYIVRDGDVIYFRFNV